MTDKVKEIVVKELNPTMISSSMKPVDIILVLGAMDLKYITGLELEQVHLTNSQFRYLTELIYPILNVGCGTWGTVFNNVDEVAKFLENMRNKEDNIKRYIFFYIEALVDSRVYTRFDLLEMISLGVTGERHEGLVPVFK